MYVVLHLCSVVLGVFIASLFSTESVSGLFSISGLELGFSSGLFRLEQTRFGWKRHGSAVKGLCGSEGVFGAVSGGVMRG